MASELTVCPESVYCTEIGWLGKDLMPSDPQNPPHICLSVHYTNQLPRFQKLPLEVPEHSQGPQKANVPKWTMIIFISASAFTTTYVRDSETSRGIRYLFELRNLDLGSAELVLVSVL